MKVGPYQRRRLARLETISRERFVEAVQQAALRIAGELVGDGQARALVRLVARVERSGGDEFEALRAAICEALDVLPLSRRDREAALAARWRDVSSAGVERCLGAMLATAAPLLDGPPTVAAQTPPPAKPALPKEGFS